MRFALGVEYDGRSFSGWETQPGACTVQAVIEQALSRVANHTINTVCAGRTDSGVHAFGQVVHFDSEARRSERAWVFGANANLPRSVSITWARPMGEEFHARFSAHSRWYQYVIFNRAVRSAILHGKCTWECQQLDHQLMQAAGDYLLGEQDFTSYRALACQAKNPVRTVHRLEVIRRGDLVIVDVVANAFLHHMVRNMVGVLMAVGKGKREPVWARQVLAARDRARGGVTAPPDGLYLMGVDYPQEMAIPNVALRYAA